MQRLANLAEDMLHLQRADGAERDNREYMLALQLLDDIERYTPPTFPTRPYELERNGAVDFAAESVANLIRDARGETTTLGASFAQFRARVTELEAISQKRLEVLCDTARKLSALLPRTRVPEVQANIRAALERMHYSLGAFWQLEMPGAHEDLRTWTLRVTREYELLPITWRYL